MSISSAPSSAAPRALATRSAIGYCPDGNPVATEATRTLLEPSRARAGAIIVGYTQTAATAGTERSTGSGRIALAQSAATLPGVSAPSSVVRSTMRTVSSRACSFDSRLIDRFASSAARASRATASTEPTRPRRGANGSVSRGTVGVWLTSLKGSPGGFACLRAGYAPVRHDPNGRPHHAITHPAARRARGAGRDRCPGRIVRKLVQLVVAGIGRVGTARKRDEDRPRHRYRRPERPELQPPGVRRPAAHRTPAGRFRQGGAVHLRLGLRPKPDRPGGAALRPRD